MKICCLSDLHGYFPEVPDCDLLLLAGDYCPCDKKIQHFWFRDKFAPWLENIRNRNIEIVGIAGNHDWMFQIGVDLIPKLNWHYLQDELLEINGLKIWGTPWQLTYWDWAFNLDEEDLEKKWELIPEDVDIIVVHGPPHGYGDFFISKVFPYNQTQLGSKTLTLKIEKIKPKLVVCGHIHLAHGIYYLNETQIVNASYVDDYNNPFFEPIIVNL